MAHCETTTACEEEPFLHALVRLEGEGGWTYVVCTQHVSELKIDPPLVIEGVAQVHEVEPPCLEDGSAWNVEENCCVVQEPDDDLALQEKHSRPLVGYRGR